MRWFSSFIVNHKKLIVLAYLIFIVFSLVGMQFVSIEYDLGSYLPKDMNSIVGKGILQEDFQVNGSAKLLIKSSSLSRVQEIKDRIKAVPGVKNVIWLDDVEDIMKEEGFFDQDITSSFRTGEYNQMQIEFFESDDAVSTKNAIDAIDAMIPEEHYIGGPAAVSKDMQDTVSRELIYYSIAAFVVISILLILSSTSYFEPILFFITLGAAIIMNMGTNFIFGRISSNTYSVAGILQLAVSMDYSIFILHRFHDELKLREKKEAMMVAIEKTFSSVSASAFTTVCGFLALIPMQYGIGKDMGLVLAKGVFFSLVSVLTLLPVLALATDDRFNRYKHRILLPDFHKTAKYLVKLRYLAMALCILVAIPAFLGQSRLNYYYSTEKTLSEASPAVVANRKISEVFGKKNEMILIVPVADRVKINDMTKELKLIQGVGSIDGLYSSVDAALPDSFIPGYVRDRFATDTYTYLLLQMESEAEGEEAEKAIESIRDTASKYFPEYYLTGEAAVYLDLKEVTSRDFIRVNILSILLITLILLITFRSFTLPLLLVLVIQMGIWVNLSIPYFQGIELNFISFIIIGAIQLGATVDYAILFTSRYRENLESMPPVEAMVQTIKDTGRSILTSALILMAGTFSVSLITSIKSASELTLLIGRGAFISLVLVLILLPALLLLFGRLIQYSTAKWPVIKKG